MKITSFLNSIPHHICRYIKLVDLLVDKKELEIILEITKSVSSTLKINEVLMTIVSKVGEYIYADRCSIILIDGQRKYGYVIASHDDPGIDHLQIDLEKYPEICRVLETKEAVVIDDINDDPLMNDVREMLNQIHIRSLLVVPIAYQEEIIGTLFLKVRKGKHKFTQREIRFCQVVANTSANAIKNAQLYEQIKLQATTDGLTNLLNHRAFLERYQEEVMRSQRTQKPFSIMMVDVDNFKAINDTHGHHYGDKALRELARSLKDNTRSVDVVARYGGDEFICLLPEASQDQGQLVANRIIKKIREGYKEGNMPVSISIGLGTYLYHTDDSAMLLQFADQAMYLAKYKGGDQIFSFDHTETRDLNVCNQKIFETFLAIKTLRRFDNSQVIVADLTGQLKKMLSVDSSPQSLYEIVTSLSSALDARDHYTNGHSERVIEYAKQIAREVGMQVHQQEELVYLCLLHDIGKIGIPDHILNKPGKLTPEEFEIMKRHAEIGEKIISPIETLKNLKPLIRHHQEFYDGKGYPDGICGELIPLACRILSVVDTYDAMTTDRPYRNALPVEAAIAELRRCAGTQFDPNVVDIFIRILVSHLESAYHLLEPCSKVKEVI
ncbi:MAG: diguanylate cyclase [Nitrospirae bacterium]|nr:diguanylate cyclase [Nitrospirota bacterium]